MSDVPQFFLVIKRKALQRNKLKLQAEIVRKCGDGLTEQACLKLPCGLDWKIGLTKSSDGKVWIDNGWPEFSKHYSIAFGHLLVFGYKGNSQFQVTIFDDTAIEIDYNSFGKNVEEEPNDYKNMDSCPMPCPSKATKRDHTPAPRTRTSPFRGQPSSHQSPGKLSTKEKSKALERISCLKFNDPFFISHIQPSYVNVQAYPFLSVPIDFAKSYIGTGTKQLILKVGDGENNSWPVTYLFKRDTDIPRIFAGWKDFAQDTALKRGDLCVFAMIKTIESIIFDVSIYRENENADSTLVPLVESKKAKPVCAEALLMQSTAVEGVFAEKDGN